MHDFIDRPTKKITRRTFSGLALWSTLSAPALLAQGNKVPAETVDLPQPKGQVPKEFQQKIRKALHSTEKKASALRAYRLRRDTQPALILGVFDAPEMFALEGNRDVR